MMCAELWVKARGWMNSGVRKEGKVTLLLGKGVEDM